jgi:hypothetical protein
LGAPGAAVASHRAVTASTGLKEELMGFLPKKTYFFPLTQDMLMIHHTSIAVALSATIGISSPWTFSAAIGSWGF